MGFCCDPEQKSDEAVGGGCQREVPGRNLAASSKAENAAARRHVCSRLLLYSSWHLSAEGRARSSSSCGVVSWVCGCLLTGLESWGAAAITVMRATF